MSSDSKRYWIIVASRDHAIRGVVGGFCQANHGREAPLRRMKRGDSVVLYSPKETFEGDTPCRKFTAMGEIKDDRTYRVDMTSDFHPFRRDVAYSSVDEVSIEQPSLISKLSFIKNKKSWGYVFRLGFFEIPRKDFDLIASHMHPRE